MGERGRLEGGSQLFPEMGRAEAGRSCIALFGSPRHSHTAPHLTLHCSTMGRPGSPLFTLNPPPTPPCRYYRDALITMALAAAANSRDGHHQYVGVPLQVQVRGWKGGGGAASAGESLEGVLLQVVVGSVWKRGSRLLHSIPVVGEPRKTWSVPIPLLLPPPFRPARSSPRMRAAWAMRCSAYHCTAPRVCTQRLCPHFRMRGCGGWRLH